MAKKMNAENTAENELLNKEVRLPIEWHFPEGLIGRYANHITIQTAEHECHISFFEIQPPLFLGEPDEVKKQMEELQRVRATCVARVVVTKDRLADFTDALNSATARFVGEDRTETQKRKAE
jgi:hypothetical protein